MSQHASPNLADYQPKLHRTQNWAVTKPSARGKRGMVVSQSKAAAEAGVAVLEAGGNAADAAVAAAFALAVVEPWNSGLGGIGFGMVHRAGAENAEVLDFGPVAPKGVDPAAYRLTGQLKKDFFTWPEVEGDRNIHGPLSALIPSSVAGYDLLRERFGTGMPLAELLGPAVALARRGLPQDWFTLIKVAASAKIIRLYPESARIYLPDGLPPTPPYQGNPGFFRQGNLAETLERLRRHGLRDFYEGGVAADLVADLRELGSFVSAGDLAECRAAVRPATVLDWRGRFRVQSAGGLTAAPTLAAVMRQMAEARPSGEPDAAWYVALSQAMRDAYAERLTSLGAANPPPEPAETCTTHLTATDAEGNMVSLTTTLLSSMGSRMVLPKTGVLMNNGMMWFDPTPGSANAIRPGARPLCNMLPLTVSEAGKAGPVIAVGASGGRRILASVYQMLAYSLDFGMGPEEAAAMPRIDVSSPDATSADPRLPGAVLEALAGQVGLELVEHATMPVNYACPNIIRWEDGEAVGVSDVMSPSSGAVAAG